MSSAILPSVTLSIGMAAALTRLTRSSLLEILGEDFIRTAHAKGLTERAVICRHALKGALIPEMIATIGPKAMLGDYASLVQGVPPDSQQAAQLLDRAGWEIGSDGVRARNGRRLSLTLIAWTEFDKATLEFIQAQLAAIGVEIRIAKSPDTASYQARVESGEFDLDLEGGSQNDANPIFLPALRFYSKSSGKTIRYFAPGSVFDEIIEAGLSANDRSEVMRRSAEAQHLLVDEETTVIPLAGLKRIYAMTDKVGDFTPHPSLLNQRWDLITIKR
jgi:peptide/nickel transport system substrate-binding protein